MAIFGRKRPKRPEKLEFEFLAGKMKFEFLGYYASIWACLEHLDGGKASEILKNQFWLAQSGFEKIEYTAPKMPKFPNSSKCLFIPKNQFILNFTGLPIILVP